MSATSPPADALPSAVQVQAAAERVPLRRNLLSADELQEWLSHWDISLAEWNAEMRRSLVEPVADISAQSVTRRDRAFVLGACRVFGQAGELRS